MTTSALLDCYRAVKAKHGDSIAVFRLGDFGETFCDDARLLGRLLGLPLSSQTIEGERVDMVGFPWGSRQDYISKLVRAGFRVALCEPVK